MRKKFIHIYKIPDKKEETDLNMIQSGLVFLMTERKKFSETTLNELLKTALGIIPLTEIND